MPSPGWTQLRRRRYVRYSEGMTFPATQKPVKPAKPVVDRNDDFDYDAWRDAMLSEREDWFRDDR